MLDSYLPNARTRSAVAVLIPVITTALAAPAEAQEITVTVSGIVSQVSGNSNFQYSLANTLGNVVHGSMTYQCPGEDLHAPDGIGLFNLTVVDASASVTHHGDNYTWSDFSAGGSYALTHLNNPTVESVPTGVGNGICEVNEGCVNGDHNLTETLDCEGVTTGPLDEQYCFVEGVCVDNTTSPLDRSPCPNPPPGPESLSLNAALTGPELGCGSEVTIGPGGVPTSEACPPFVIEKLRVFLGDRYGNGLTSENHPTELVMSDWHQKEASLVFNRGALNLFVLSMSASGSCPGVPVDGDVSTYLGPRRPRPLNPVPPVLWPRDNGPMPITISGSAEVDVRLIDARSIRIGPNRARLTGDARLVRRDFDGDGRLDARGMFRPSEAGLDRTSTELCTSMNLIGTTVHSCTELTRTPVADDEPTRTQERIRTR